MRVGSMLRQGDLIQRKGFMVQYAHLACDCIQLLYIVVEYTILRRFTHA